MSLSFATVVAPRASAGRILHLGAICVLALFQSACTQAPQRLPADEATTPAPACSTPTVLTTGGRVCGLALTARAAYTSDVSRIKAFLGIPYARSPAGPKRWTAPEPVTEEQAIVEATAFGPVCPQPREHTGDLIQSEDCLSLNIWTPSGIPAAHGAKLPVMVFIHGGGFVRGTGSNLGYDGRRLAKRGKVVVVTLNYRLGALGFLAGIHGLEGNYGFRDQQLALRWVQENIHAFGGDAAKVTLVGHSSGAMSVALHLVAPGSWSLFRAAIMQSNPYGVPFKSKGKAHQFGTLLRTALRCQSDTLDCMKQKSFDEIVEQQTSTSLDIQRLFAGLPGYVPWGPVVDGELIPRQPNHTSIAKPVLVGTNLDEGVVFAFKNQTEVRGQRVIPRLNYELALDFAFSYEAGRRIKAQQRYQPRRVDNTEQFSHVVTDYLFTCANRHVMALAASPVYAYHFRHVPSYSVWPDVALCAAAQRKVCHGFELPYVFANPRTLTLLHGPEVHRFTPAETKLSDTMLHYWSTFAHRLDPNHDGAPHWPRFQLEAPRRLVFGTEITVALDLGANCEFWESVGYD